jgi:hypothetical protein
MNAKKESVPNSKAPHCLGRRHPFLSLSRNRLSPRYILYSNHTDDTIVQNKEMLGRQQKHAQKKINEDNGESMKQ